MALLSLAAVVIFWPELWRVHGDSHPCFASEKISSNERRFFAFTPANVHSEPLPIDCVFVFGGPPGSLLRLGLYDVSTKKGPQVYVDQDGSEDCESDVIRVYDVDQRGLQLRATYCGLLQRGKMLAMSSNMAVVTYTSDVNDPDNTFSLGVDAIDERKQTSQKPPEAPCQKPSTAVPEIAIDSTTREATGGGDDDRDGGDPTPSATAPIRDDRYSDDWVNSGDSESGEQGATWYEVAGGGGGETSTGDIATTSTALPSPEGGVVVVEGDDGVSEVGESSEILGESTGIDPGLDGEEAGKVVAVFSNGSGDEDSQTYYYYL